MRVILVGQVALASALILGGYRALRGEELPAGWAKFVTIRTYEEFDGAQWYLILMNGELGFFARGVAPSDPNTRSIPTKGGQASQDGCFTVDGAMLRMDVRKEHRERFKEQDAKHGWYLTADYSTDPPSVILAKKPTKYSEWTFEKIRWEGSGPEGYDVYIKNDNDLGKPAWLSMADKGIRYKGGSELRKPILSKKKIPFYVAAAYTEK